MPAPKSTGAHKTFDLEEEFGEDPGELGSMDSDEGADSAPPSTVASNDEPESDSGSEVEEITTQSARQAARASASAEQKRRAREHEARREKQQRRAKPAQASRRARRVQADEDDEDDAKDAEDAEESAVSSGRVTSRLDPALFAAAFAHRDAQARAALQQQPAPSQAPATKKRYARGRDGQPMVRVANEATLVRALAPEREVDVVDAALEHEPLDPSRALPSARERAYRKRKLGLRANDVRASAIDAVKRAPAKQKKPRAKDPDDPLGLNDPAFQEGGEFAHLARSHRKRARSRAPTPAAASVRGAGGRVAAPYAARLGPALQFARGR
ncbi:hypothetical protein MBRA1_001162 [Malassezia brasiliensis]|uniref:Uncharacterized protein n=1 Tax=Malassezia brasiliensis TaxID=1821822 RepID=A0AAF0IN36_9BASI|nr:hypothetical protein MBRA1_001162 [Malassezia brasiliensis]